jgi:hypothetical protein
MPLSPPAMTSSMVMSMSGNAADSGVPAFLYAGWCFTPREEANPLRFNITRRCQRHQIDSMSALALWNQDESLPHSRWSVDGTGRTHLNRRMSFWGSVPNEDVVAPDLANYGPFVFSCMNSLAAIFLHSAPAGCAPQPIG